MGSNVSLHGDTFLEVEIAEIRPGKKLWSPLGSSYDGLGRVRRERLGRRRSIRLL
jgi:hypothetical protein